MAMSSAMKRALLLLHTEGVTPTDRLLCAGVLHGYILIHVTPEALLETTAPPRAKRPDDPLPAQFEDGRAYFLRRVVMHGSGGWDAIPMPASIEASLVEGGEIEVNGEGRCRATAFGHKRVMG